MSTERRHWIRWLIALAKVALFAILCWAIYYAFVSGNETLSAHTWHVEPEWLVVSGVLYLLGVLPSAVFWHSVLVHAGQEVRLFPAVRAYYISQLGKYVPGKWMVIVLRRALVEGPKVENTVVAASVFFETFTMLAVGAAISAVVLLIGHHEQLLLIAAAVGSTALLGVPTIPVVFRWLVRILGVDKLNPTAGAKIASVPARRSSSVGSPSPAAGCCKACRFGPRCVQWARPLVGPLSTSRCTPPPWRWVLWPVSSRRFPVGWAMREWVSAELIEPQYGRSVAIVSAVLFRLVLLVSELGISVILYLAAWRRTRKSVSSELKPS